MTKAQISALKHKLINCFIANPKEGQELAVQFGLWDWLYQAVAKPIHLCLCREDINAFLEYIMVDPETGGAVKQQPFHHEWQAIITKFKRVLIAAPRGHGKCQTGETLNTMADGSRVMVKDLILGQEYKFLSWTEEDGYSTQPGRVWQSTRQNCYEVKTRAGRTTSYSEEHPCWTSKGWVATKDLLPGDRFAVALSQPHGTKEVSSEEAWLMGLIIGDGGIKYHQCGITSADPVIDLEIMRCSAFMGFTMRHGSEKYPYCHSLPHGALPWLERYGLRGKGSYTKRIPAECFTWNAEGVRALLDGYWQADGSASSNGSIIEYCSVSKELLGDVQSLLLRFGVTAQISEKHGTYLGLPHLSYRLLILGGSREQFVGLLTGNQPKTLVARELAQKKSNANVDVIPDALMNRLSIRRGFRSDKKNGCDLSNRRLNGHLRRKVLRHAEIHPNGLLANNANLFWDEIVSVKCIGRQQTYSVEIDNTHVHITDDFITHNTIQVIGRIVWELGRNHDLRVKIIGASDEKAREVLGLVSELIKSSPQVQEVFPDLIIDSERGDKKEAFFVMRNIAQRDPSVQASGVMSAGAGGRADLLVCDDVVDVKNAVTNPAMREQVIRAIKETWFSLVASQGRIVWICTPYHVADCSHDLKNTPGNFWKVWWTPAINKIEVMDKDNRPRMEPVFDDKGELVHNNRGEIVMRSVMETTYLWPEKWGEETLASKRIEVGERVFARQYLLNAMSDEERTFPERGIKKSYDIMLGDIGEGIDDNWPTFGGVDLASSLGKKAAYTVIWTLARNPVDKRLYFKSMWRAKIDFNEIMSAIKSEYEKHHWRFCYVENNGFQKAVIDAADKDHKDIPIQGFHTSASGKFNELVGLPGLAVSFEKGLFALPAARFTPEGELTGEDNTGYGVFLDELRSHPGGEHSDTVMALWFAYRAAIEGISDFESSWIDAISSIR
jgi:hypothetical protein